MYLGFFTGLNISLVCMKKPKIIMPEKTTAALRNGNEERRPSCSARNTPTAINTAENPPIQNALPYIYRAPYSLTAILLVSIRMPSVPGRTEIAARNAAVIASHSTAVIISFHPCLRSRSISCKRSLSELSLIIISRIRINGININPATKYLRYSLLAICGACPQIAPLRGPAVPAGY